MADAWAEFDDFKKDKVDTGQVGAADFFGTEEDLNGNYLYRMAGAVLGIYGNTKEEALYPRRRRRLRGRAADRREQLHVRFEPGQLPPVNAFWSLTMYQLPAKPAGGQPDRPVRHQLADVADLVSGPRRRGSRCTCRTSHRARTKEANWLPAPKGPFLVALRLYWPKPDALDGQWQAPKPVKA